MLIREVVEMEKTVHHYLHEKIIGTVVASRIDASTIVCELPNEDKEYFLPVDERDQRCLVVFDGDLLFGGLPRSAIVVKSILLDKISCPADSMRKIPDYPCEATIDYHLEGKDAWIEIFRHFLLLPSSTAIVRKFRNKSLSPIFVTINVSTNEKGTRIVEWQTTSY
jgi:hypothetical protein